MKNMTIGDLLNILSEEWESNQKRLKKLEDYIGPIVDKKAEDNRQEIIDYIDGIDVEKYSQSHIKCMLSELKLMIPKHLK